MRIHVRHEEYSMNRYRAASILTVLLAIVLTLIPILIFTGCRERNAAEDEASPKAGEIAGNTEQSAIPVPGAESETDTAATKGIYGEGYTQAELFAHDYVLYFVDCASEKYLTGTDREKGLFQSRYDMELGEDPGTGRRWGYQAREDIVSEADGNGSKETLMRWTVNTKSDYDNDSTGIYYSFEVPDGEYDITCGFFDPFSTRKIDVLAEGECLISQEKIFKYELSEYTCAQRVTDGSLDIRVCNLNRGRDRMQNPMLSYIIIRVVPEYDAEVLELYRDRCLEMMQAEYAAAANIVSDQAELYTENSFASWNKVADEVAELLAAAGQGNGTDGYKEEVKKLMKAFNGLEKKVIYASFNPGKVWLDTDGNPIQAHGGHIQRLAVTDPETGVTAEKWWWVGEDKTNGYRGGINAYSSDDLYNWKFEGSVMRNVVSRSQLDTEEYFKELYAGYTKEQLDNVYMCINSTTSVIERPKMIYNPKTDMYVIWFHADGPTATSNSNYAAASAGVAVSKSPYGPFRFIDRYRLNVCPPDQEDKHPSSRGMARDMNLFIDDDGTAYIIYSSEENLTLYISKLNDEYTYLATDPSEAVYGVDFIRIFPGAQREAPAMFKHDGTYYLMTSGCTGWAPNQARYAMSSSVMGTWVNMGDPCIGDNSHTTFDSQSTCIFCTDGRDDEYIYMGDRWKSEELNDSRYIWLPVEFDDEGRMFIEWTDEFVLRD